MMNSVLKGAAAGAAGTTALNTLTYLDMAVRGRPSSSAPEETVERLAGKADLSVPGEGEQHDNRVSGLGPLLGVATGVGVGAAYGAARALGWRPPAAVAALVTAVAAMAGSDLPITVLGISDPRSWRPVDWVSDVLPHLAYGAVTAACVAADGRAEE